jgi:hypothetical protein
VGRDIETFFDAPSLGIPVHTYIPGLLALAVTSAFSFGGGPSVGAISDNTAYQAQNDFSQVIGPHQLSFGANVAYSKLDQMNAALRGCSSTISGTSGCTGRTRGAPPIG